MWPVTCRLGHSLTFETSLPRGAAKSSDPTLPRGVSQTLCPASLSLHLGNKLLGPVAGCCICVRRHGTRSVRIRAGTEWSIFSAFCVAYNNNRSLPRAYYVPGIVLTLCQPVAVLLTNSVNPSAFDAGTFIIPIIQIDRQK